ncbi:MAG: hypothetical protein N5P05_002693 [Chroococcopsis gigantea SAG 12.99]|nr:hypothetical protein [Chroococcopsis gigantea SAG 12.99]
MTLTEVGTVIKSIVNIYKTLANNTLSLNNKYLKLLKLAKDIEIEQVGDILANLAEIKK